MHTTPNAERKDFVCQFCRRRFGRFEHKQRHERLHTNEQPFPCLQCEKRFTRKDLLNRHVNIKHPQNTDPSSISQNVRVVPAAEEQQQAYDVIIDPLWDLPLSQLQFNNSAPSSDYLDNYFAPSNQGQASWPNVLDFSLTEENGPSCDMSAIPVENPPQWFTTSHDRPISNTLMDYSSSSGPESSNAVSTTPLLSASVNMSSIGTDQGFFQLRSPAILSDQQTTTLVSCGSSVSSNLFYKSFVLKASPKLWDLDVDAISQLELQKAQFLAVVPSNFLVPGKATLVRYMYHYEKKFQPHFPILHSATFRAEHAHLDLILTIAAAGSMICEDNENATKMFTVAKDITLKRVRERRKRLFDQKVEAQLYEGSDEEHGHTLEARKETLQISQALVMQLNLACMMSVRSSLMQVIELKTVLADFLRDHCLTWSSRAHDSSWQEWALGESMKRVIYASLNVLTLVTILVIHPPVLLNNELDIELPCVERVWQCKTQEEWRSIHTSTKPLPTFQTVLRQLLDGTENYDTGHDSVLANHALILALFQHFHFLRQLDFRSSNNANNLYRDISSHHEALEKWKIMWESCIESSLDPLSSNGPLAFTSAVLYHSAFVQNYLNLRKMCLLDDIDPTKTAEKLYESRIISRNPQVTQIVMHAVCALAMPLRLGLNYAVPDKSPLLTLDFAMCALECCVLLTQWLSVISITMVNANSELSSDERKVLDTINDLLDETAPAALVNSSSTDSSEKNHRMTVRVAKAWADLFSGTTVRLFMRLRTVLNCYGDLLAAV